MLEFSDFQFALLKRAGCLEASMLLHSILRNAHDSTKALAMLSLDILKAFGTIFYYAVLKSSRKTGLPPTLVKYLHHLYSTAKAREVQDVEEESDRVILCPQFCLSLR